MSWLIIGIFSAIIFSVVNIIDKVFLVRCAISPRSAIGIFGLFGILFSVALIIFNPLVYIAKPFWILFLSGVFEVVYVYFYLKAIAGDEVGYLVPFFGLSPLLALFFSFILFDFVFAPSVIWGSIAIISGIFFLVIAKYGLKHIIISKYLLFMLVAAALYALQSVALEYAGGHYHWLDALQISRFGLIAGALLIWGFRSDGFGVFLRAKSYVFFISEILYLFATYLFIATIAKGHAFYALSILNTQPFIVLVFSYILFKIHPQFLQEKLAWYSKTVAVFSIALVVIGTILLKV